MINKSAINLTLNPNGLRVFYFIQAKYHVYVTITYLKIRQDDAYSSRIINKLEDFISFLDMLCGGNCLPCLATSME